MPDVSGFVAPISNYEGLYKIGDDLRQKNYHDAQMKQDAAGKKDASLKFFTNYLDDKDKFTGTNYDPVKHRLIASALTQAVDLIGKGATDADIMTAISKPVSQAVQYDFAAKNYAASKKKFLDDVDAVGIDKTKLAQQMDENAFYEIDPTTGQKVEKKDFASINPDATIYADKALREGNVYNSGGFDKVYKDADNIQSISKFKRINSRGGYDAGDFEVTTKNYLTPNIDPKTQKIDDSQPFVPKYQTVADDDAALVHTFNQDGKNVTAPIRVLDNTVFNNLPNSAKAYALQEARTHLIGKPDPITGKPIRPDDPRVEMFAKAVAYDELNSDLRKSGVIKKVETNKATPIKNITNINNGGGKGTAETTINDVYGDVTTQFDAGKKTFGKDYKLPANELKGTAQKFFLKEARDATGDNNISEKDFYLKQEDNGDINIISSRDDDAGKQWRTVNVKDVNIPVQSTGKQKVSALKKALNIIGIGKNKPTTKKAAFDDY